ncbi:hypothetical protein JRC04_22985 [Mycolicibacterium sp. S2-37]|uniref:hypothetical protein n=1 Tax=Mycolicibacterium sp. S2-37 TaxID=2810297 RepID=UPI001A93D0BA|nr:hypothetical protein [Mycolicibacterium sp. S2-37]MBO0680341.1 hypothetical protein [Mycolicibacterium sp. S2-37]
MEPNETNDEITRRVRENLRDDMVLVALPRDMVIDLGRRLLQAVSPAPADWSTIQGFRIDDIGATADE